MAIDGKQSVFSVLLYLLAAFDTLDQGDLITHVLGIDGTAVKWFTSYLTNERVRMGNMVYTAMCYI